MFGAVLSRDRGEPLPGLKLHGLRHTWATLALQEGIDIHIVSDRLDHSSTHITREIYTHVTRPMQSDAADKVAARIFRVSDPTDGEDPPARRRRG